MQPNTRIIAVSSITVSAQSVQENQLPEAALLLSQYIQKESIPRVDGMQLCLQVKSDERTSHIPVILLTAKVDPSSKLECYQLGR